MSDFFKKISYLKYYLKVFFTYLSNISLKRFFLKIKYGKRLSIKHSVKLGKGVGLFIQSNTDGKIILGKGDRLSEGVSLSSFHGGEINVGNNSYFNKNCIIVARKAINIGDNVSFGPNVSIFDHDHEFDRNGFSANSYKESEISIGNNCWIGAGVIILRGTTIGDGTVIGAGSVVKGIIPSHSLVKSNRDIIFEEIR